MKQPFLAEDGVSGTILELDASEWKALLARPTETEYPNLVEFCILYSCDFFFTHSSSFYTIRFHYDSRYPLTIKSGKGCKLYTTDGKEYLDMVAGIATCALGHANDKLTQAVVDQMNQVHHVSNLYYIPSQAKLATWLCDNSVADKVFFCNSGAEANEAAIKCARRHAHNRGITEPVIITAINSFHGRTLAALTATAQPKYHKGFGYGGEMVQGFEYVPYNNVEALKAKVTGN